MPDGPNKRGIGRVQALAGGEACGIAEPEYDRSYSKEGAEMTRLYVDCRQMPSESNCDLAMSGSEEHLIEAAAIHAVTAHGHEDTPELREEIRAAAEEEVPGALA
jgi:Protein of unknown function (DUF1059)